MAKEFVPFHVQRSQRERLGFRNANVRAIFNIFKYIIIVLIGIPKIIKLIAKLLLIHENKNHLQTINAKKNDCAARIKSEAALIDFSLNVYSPAVNKCKSVYSYVVGRILKRKKRHGPSVCLVRFD